VVTRRTNRGAVNAVLASLRREGVMSTTDEALGQLALTLAETLDGDAGMATAAVSRELRATLASLTAKEEVIDDADEIFGADLPAQVRNPEKP
jgi:hypothetical protein